MKNGPRDKTSDADFMRLFNELGASRTAKRLGIGERPVYQRRARLEARYGRQIKSPDATRRATRHAEPHPGRINIEVRNGIVLIASDGHYWPGPATTAHRSFVKFCKDWKPSVVIMNGDAFDGATISRHPPIGWEENPTVEQEIEAVKERLGEIEAATFKTRKVWPLGNHDARFETRLATVAPEYARLNGFHLRDHFPHWEPCWSVWLNDDVVVKHRLRSGVHATHNNTVNSGKTMVTGHLHSLKVTPFSDYADRPRWGIDCGCLADPNGRQFLDYSEDAPRNHRAGFVFLKFKDGKLLWPEVVHVFDKDHVEFRGELLKV